MCFFFSPINRYLMCVNENGILDGEDEEENSGKFILGVECTENMSTVSSNIG